MTLNMLTDPLYAGRRDETDSTNYPYATFKDKTSTTGNNGTPLTYAKQYKDFDGFRQAVIALGKITPSGDPDTAVTSQILNGLFAQYGGGLSLYSSLADSSDRGDYARAELLSSTIRHTTDLGTSYQLSTSLQGGGVKFAGTAPGDYSPNFRVSAFDVTTWGDTWEKNGDLLHYNVSENISLTGVPQAANIYGINIKVLANSGIEYNCPATFSIRRGTGSWLILENVSFTLPVASETIAYTSDPVIVVFYNPEDVD